MLTRASITFHFKQSFKKLWLNQLLSRLYFFCFYLLSVSFIYFVYPNLTYFTSKKHLQVELNSSTAIPNNQVSSLPEVSCLSNRIQLAISTQFPFDGKVFLKVTHGNKPQLKILALLRQHTS